MRRKLDNKRMDALLKATADYEEFLELCRDAESGMTAKTPDGAAPDFQSFLKRVRQLEKDPKER